MDALPDILLVRMSRELTEQMFTRDADGRRLKVSWPEPDGSGMYTPIVSVLFDDDLLAESRRIIAELLKQGIHPGACDNEDAYDEPCTLHFAAMRRREREAREWLEKHPGIVPEAKQ